MSERRVQVAGDIECQGSITVRSDQIDDEHDRLYEESRNVSITHQFILRHAANILFSAKICLSANINVGEIMHDYDTEHENSSKLAVSHSTTAKYS